MAVTEYFRKAVSAGNIRSLRIMMKNSLIVDLTFAEFNEMSRIACNVKGLYDIHDETELNYDKTAWTRDYMEILMVQVVSNFSHERIEHLKKIVTYLYPEGNRIPAPDISNDKGTKQKHSSYQKQKRQDQQNGNCHPGRKEKIAGGTIAGGVAGGVIGAFSGGAGAIVIGIVVGAAVVGTAVALTANGEQ